MTSTGHHRGRAQAWKRVGVVLTTGMPEHQGGSCHGRYPVLSYGDQLSAKLTDCSPWQSFIDLKPRRAERAITMIGTGGWRCSLPDLGDHLFRHSRRDPVRVWCGEVEHDMRRPSIDEALNLAD